MKPRLFQSLFFHAKSNTFQAVLNFQILQNLTVLPHTFQVIIILIFHLRVVSFLNFRRQRFFDPCWIIFNLLPNIDITLFFTFFFAQIGAVPHQCFAGCLVHLDKALQSIITAWPSEHRFPIGFAVYWVIFKSLLLTEITSNLFFWRFTFYYFFFICYRACCIFVEGKVIAFVSFGCVSVFRCCFIWRSEVQ